MKWKKFFEIGILQLAIVLMLSILNINASAASKGKIRAMILIGDAKAVTSDAMMQDFFAGNTMGGYSVEEVRRYEYSTSWGVTESGIDECINSSFKGSTQNDICFFYYGGHGTVNTNTKTGVGITLTDKTYYDYDMLAEKLTKFKGKIYVILDCCYAGEFINAVKRLPSYKRNRVVAMTASGNRATGLKFFKSGWDILKLSESYQRFTYMISKGVGTKGGESLEADKNKDGTVTLKELYNYVNNIINTSNPQYYGNDNTILYRAEVKLDKTTALIYIAENRTLQLKASVSVPKAKISWKSSNTSIASVNSKGKVTAKKSGSVIITAKAKGVTAKCKITIKQIKPQIKLNKTTATIYTTGTKTVQLKATVKGESSKVTWTSSNKNVAVVNGKGLVTAKAAGTVVITAKANGKTAKCKVIVKKVTKTSISAQAKNAYKRYLSKKQSKFNTCSYKFEVINLPGRKTPLLLVNNASYGFSGSMTLVGYSSEKNSDRYHEIEYDYGVKQLFYIIRAADYVEFNKRKKVIISRCNGPWDEVYVIYDYNGNEIIRYLWHYGDGAYAKYWSNGLVVGKGTTISLDRYYKEIAKYVNGASSYCAYSNTLHANTSVNRSKYLN